MSIPSEVGSQVIGVIRRSGPDSDRPGRDHHGGEVRPGAAPRVSQGDYASRMILFSPSRLKGLTPIRVRRLLRLAADVGNELKRLSALSRISL
jgi:hypothetical protein